jgi:hypothetical protein
MTYWKIEFLDTLTGEGWLECDTGKLYDLAGNLIKQGVSYRPCEGGTEENLKPDWVE